jgi:cation:H+ antiporter
MFTYLLFVVGFFLLIKGADLLVSGASSVAKRFKISDLVIGLTIVAFGTSMPELVVNILASTQGNTEIAIGNVLGSNIANILLILGVSAIIFPLTVHKNTVWKEIPFSLLAVLSLFFLANDALLDGYGFSELSRAEGAVLLLFFCIFLYYTFGIASLGSDKNDQEIVTEEVPVQSAGRSVGFIILGLAGLVIGGNWIVEGAVAIASSLGLSQSLIGLTVIAVGTSLPELATSAVAAKKQQTDIAIGNVVGSNIFNIFWILGVSSIISPLPFGARSNIDIIMAVVATLLLFLFCFVGKKHTITRLQGIMFVAIYVLYVAYLVVAELNR